MIIIIELIFFASLFEEIHHIAANATLMNFPVILEADHASHVLPLSDGP